MDRQGGSEFKRRQHLTRQNLPNGLLLELSRVLRTLCEDLLMGTHERRVLTGSVNAETLSALLNDVSNPELQEFHTAVTALELSYDFASGHIQRCKQRRCAMAVGAT